MYAKWEKKIMKTILFSAVAIFALVSTANAGVTTFSRVNNSADSLNLTNGKPDRWNLTYNLAENEFVTAARITYYDVLATDYSKQDRLITKLIDLSPASKNKKIGIHNPAGKYYYRFATCFEFTEGFSTKPATFSYDLAGPGIAALNTLESSLQNGQLEIRTKAIGNFSIKNMAFELSTDFNPVAIPAPDAILLVTIGTAIVGYLRTKRKF